MKLLRYILGSALLGLALGAAATPASAQATRTWVSGVGDDVNPCSRTAPCKTFAGAISKTAAGGEINCLDPAGFGAVTVTKSITLDCTGTLGSILAAGSTGVIINGANIDVILRGLSINGGTPASAGVNGIRYLQARSLVVEDCVIFNFNAAAPNGNGIMVNNTSGTADIVIRNTRISNNARLGIALQPSASQPSAGTGSIIASIETSSLSNNVGGIRADNLFTSGTIKVDVVNSVISNNSSHGFIAEGGTGAISAFIESTTLSNNTLSGVRVVNATATTMIGDTNIVSNGTGTETVNGGILFSFGNNRINLNTNNGPNPSVVAQK